MLEQALHLAQRERKRPQQASLRRAISTAYYALFHLLISETVKNWKRPKERFTLARMFEHAAIDKACKKCRDDLFARKKNRNLPLAPSDLHVLKVTQTFLDMYQGRQTADYDGAKTWTRVEVLERLDAVKEAFKSWKAAADSHQAQNFLVTLLLKDRKP